MTVENISWLTLNELKYNFTANNISVMMRDASKFVGLSPVTDTFAVKPIYFISPNEQVPLKVTRSKFFLLKVALFEKGLVYQRSNYSSASLSLKRGLGDRGGAKTVSLECSLWSLSIIAPDEVHFFSTKSFFLFLYKNIYSSLPLPLSPRDPLKYFEISVPRHIRFAELRKK